MLRYKIAPKCLLPGPFGHSDVGGNPGVAGRFVAIISFLHTLVRGGGGYLMRLPGTWNKGWSLYFRDLSGICRSFSASTRLTPR